MIDNDLNGTIFLSHKSKSHESLHPLLNTTLTASNYRLPHTLYFRRIPHALFPLTRQIQQPQMKQYLTQ